MDPQQRRCPECGATAGVRYRTATVDGVLHPVDPKLVCAHGHTTPLPSDLAHLRDDETTRRLADDDGLIG